MHRRTFLAALAVTGLSLRARAAPPAEERLNLANKRLAEIDFPHNSHLDHNLFYNINDGGHIYDPVNTTFSYNFGTLIHRMGNAGIATALPPLRKSGLCAWLTHVFSSASHRS